MAMQDVGNGSSVVRRWQLAATMKEMREKADLTQDEAVDRLRKSGGRWSHAKLSRIENRVHRLKPREVEQLLDVYGVSDTARREELVRMAAESKDRGWWVRFGADLPDVTKPLLSMEDGLVQLRDFQNQLVHGLLQTSDYARAVMTAVNPGQDSPEELERRVAARMIRQHVLRKQPPPRMHFILDQGVLERPVGGSSVMQGQLLKLLELTASPNITIQILPVEAGGSPGLVGPFSLLTLPDPIPDICYAEGPAGTFYLEDREHVRTCTLRFGILTELALSRAESVKAMNRAMKRYE
ncbi:helix-turn-helix transcriptional regulator [Streptomyces sp. SCUT-3]|uniref:helix-turn-helix domain-containing protein n=1 Tax=Streptomyces sp. SCUT-3 TaxID=2684469 RepID=UPI001C70D234|nr:helix-turn-helix transcriptional regulator [Streptomyces sp. SCUT-3]